MVARLQAWFARQSLTVKLLIAVPVLAGAVLWATLPDTSPRASDLGNRPVLAPQATPASPVSSSASGVSGTAASAWASSGPASPALAPGVDAARATVALHQEPGQIDNSLSWATLLRTLVSVAVVIGLILLSARLLKHFMASQGQLTGSGGNVRIVETTYVPAPSGRGRSALHLIEVGDRLLLVGATDTNLALLAEFEDGAGGLGVPGSPGVPGGGRVRLASRAASSAAPVPASGATAAVTAGASPLNFGEALAAASDKGPVNTVEAELAALARLAGEPQELEETGEPGGSGLPGLPGLARRNGHTAEHPARDADLAHMLDRLRASKQRLESDL